MIVGKNDALGARNVSVVSAVRECVKVECDEKKIWTEYMVV